MKVHIFRGEETLSEFDLDEGEYVIGSGDSAHLRVESDVLAPEHARLRIGTGGVEVEDLGSGRETWLGELALVGVQPLPAGSILQLGDISVLVGDPELPVTTLEHDDATGRYVVGEVVASGAMGVIRRARERHTGREVAMKQMRDGLDDPDLAARFVQEAKITAHLEHPNVVPVHDVNPAADGSRYYTMKMVRGVSLEKLLELLGLRTEATLKKYSLDALLTVFQKVCDAVAFAHSKGIIHRDLKPANIMVGEYGEVLVMDWGLAKLVGEAATTISPNRREAFAAAGSTLAGTIMGTPHYMAPEQATGDLELVDERSDIYALGAILYQLLTLQTPVEGRSAGEVLQQVRAGKITPPHARLGAKRLPHLPEGRVPASLAAVAMKALTFSPDRRYQRAPDLQADLRAFQSGFATGAEGAGAWRQFTLFLQRNKAVSSAIAASLVLLGLISTLYTNRVIHERDRTKSALAETEVHRKRADDALGRLRETAPDFIAKARQFLAEGMANDAIKHFGFSLDVAPENADIRLDRADLLLANNRAAEAIPEYERVLAERPDDKRARDNLARARSAGQENSKLPQVARASAPTPTVTPPAEEDPWKSFNPGPLVYEHSLSKANTLEELYCFGGQYGARAILDSGHGLKLGGGHTSPMAWARQILGKRSRIQCEFRLAENEWTWAGWVIKGPGYGNCPETGYWLRINRETLTIRKGGVEMLTKTLSKKLELGKWITMQADLSTGALAVTIDRELVATFVDPVPLIGPLHGWLGLIAGDTTFRNLRIWSAEIDTKLEQQFAPPIKEKPLANQKLLYEFSGGGGALGAEWWKLQADRVAFREGAMILSNENNGTPVVILNKPLPQRIACEVEFEYPDVEALNFRFKILFAPQLPTSMRECEGAWVVGLPHGNGLSAVQWESKEAAKDTVGIPFSSNTPSLAATGYYNPVFGRRYMARLEVLQNSLRVFLNGGLLLQANKPADSLPPTLPLFFGLAEYYSHAKVYSVRVYQINAEATGLNR